MIPQRATNLAKNIVSDVYSDVTRNVSNAQPVTAQGLAESVRSSASDRMGEQLPMVKPVMKAIESKVKSGNSTKSSNARKGRSSGKGKKSGNGKGSGKGGNKSAGGNQAVPNVQSNTSAFGNINEGQLYTIQSNKDTTYWTDVLTNQGIDYNTKNTSRTALTLIETDHTDVLQPGNSQVLKTAYSSIFMQKLNEAIGSTGGNASVKSSLTEEKFWKHQRYALSAILKLAELYSVRAWNPPYEETNTVIRQMKNALCSNVELMESTNRLEEAVAQYVLPSEAINTAIALFQTYKKSPVSGGVHTRLMSSHLYNDFVGQENFNLTKSSMDTLSDLMTDSTWTADSGTITSLLLYKCSGFSSCRVSKVGAQYPTYQMDMNAIFDNMKYSWENSNTDYVSDEPSTNDVIEVAFPFDVDNVPMHVSSSLLMRYESFGSNMTGYPWFTQHAETEASRFIALNNSNNNFNIGFAAVKFEYSDITDNNFSIYHLLDRAYFKPIGLNTQLFQPTYQVVVNATRDVIYRVYSMPSIS